MNPSLVGIFVSLHHKLYNSNMIKNENFEIIWGPRIQDINVTKCTASLEPSEVLFQSNKYLKIGGDHFTPPPYQTRVKFFLLTFAQ